VPTKSQARPPTSPAVRDDGGRTRPAHDDLEVEALVSTTSVREQTPRLTVEQRAIAALCHDILSISEVSAQLHLPLGVIRVLVGDMADEHLVIIYRPAHPGDRPRPGPAGAGPVRAHSGRGGWSPNRNDNSTKRRPAVTSRTSCRCEQLNSSAAPAAGRYRSGPYSGKRN
jgi:hypothetical protein